MSTTVNKTDEIIKASAASESFKEAVSLLEQGKSSPSIAYSPGVPPVKALRAIAKLLETETSMVVESVNIQATSGCSDFTGTLDVNGGEARFEFVWDCAWRAEQEKYVDHFGYPDQIRASREFGYQCFKKFKRVV